MCTDPCNDVNTELVSGMVEFIGLLPKIKVLKGTNLEDLEVCYQVMVLGVDVLQSPRNQIIEAQKDQLLKLRLLYLYSFYCCVKTVFHFQDWSIFHAKAVSDQNYCILSPQPQLPLLLY